MMNTIYIAFVMFVWYIINMPEPSKTAAIRPVSLNRLIIMEHPACLVSYAPDISIYHIRDKRFLEPALYDNVRKFNVVFLDNLMRALRSRIPIITIGYNHLIGKALEIHLQNYHNDGVDFWPVVSFFHDDESTSQIPCPPDVDPLDEKALIIYDMLDFQFIKKIEIPYNSVLTKAYLLSFLAQS